MCLFAGGRINPKIRDNLANINLKSGFPPPIYNILTPNNVNMPQKCGYKSLNIFNKWLFLREDYSYTSWVVGKANYLFSFLLPVNIYQENTW